MVYNLSLADQQKPCLKLGQPHVDMGHSSTLTLITVQLHYFYLHLDKTSLNGMRPTTSDTNISYRYCFLFASSKLP